MFIKIKYFLLLQMLWVKNGRVMQLESVVAITKLSYEAMGLDSCQSTFSVEEGEFLFQTKKNRREEVQVSSGVHCGCQSVWSQLGY